uniref:phospholipase A n=1 Tax=uncultured Sphingomonas sp. TaxID=158754 RepID=UPI0035CBCE72
MRYLSWVASGVALTIAAPAAAQLRPLLDPPASSDAARDGIDVYLLNEGVSAQPAQGPAEIETIARDGTRLRLVAPADAPQSIAAGGFAHVRYHLAVTPGADPVAVATVAPARASQSPAPAASPGETVFTSSRGGSAAFLDRLHPYAPTYAAFGAGNSGAKLQFSVDARLLGRDTGPHLDFAYTQTIFWAVDRPSGPIRAQGYSPELFVDVPLDSTLILSGGYRHDSNGGGVTNSIDVNRVYARATKVFDLGHAWKLSLHPQAWFYFGDQGIAPDLQHYWGYTSLGVTVGQRNGVKLAVTGRGTPGAGKASAEAFLSYPLARIDDRLPHLYLFSQFFTGYGETLVDYNRNVSHARFGIALTR